MRRNFEKFPMEIVRGRVHLLKSPLPLKESTEKYFYAP